MGNVVGFSYFTKKLKFTHVISKFTYKAVTIVIFKPGFIDNMI